MVHGVVRWTVFSSLELEMTSPSAGIFPVTCDTPTSTSVTGSYDNTMKLKDDEQNMDDLINLGDSLTRLGKLKEAVDVYAQAFCLGTVREDHLTQLIRALYDKGKGTLRGCEGNTGDMAICYFCGGVLMEPVTLPCGHTFCRTCTTEQGIPEVCCPRCSSKFNPQELASIKTNTVISNILESIWINEALSAKLRVEGNKFFKEGDFQGAVVKYSKAQEYDPHEPLVHNCLSQAFLQLGKFNESLEHAMKAIHLDPTTSKSFLHKGAALVGLGQFEEAVIAYLQCMILGESDCALKTDITKLINKLLHLHQTEKLSDKEAITESPSMSNTDMAENEAQPQTCLRLSALCEEALNLQNWTEKENTLWKEQKFRLEGIVERFETEVGKMKDLQRLTVLRPIEAGTINKKDFECSLCIRLFWEPVTTPCGHMFCRTCLNRSLDHKPYCPLCKDLLSKYLAARRDATTEFMEVVIQRFLPEDYQERKRGFEEEMEELKSAGKDPEHGVPLFVCTMAYPDIPCPLHIFEPRYRLMTRQCLESGTREFGMCSSVESEEDGIARFGTMLVIRDINYYPDGRSIVDAIGSKRFKILQTSMRDGYHVGSLEFITDNPVPEAEVEDVIRLHNEVYSEVSQWFSTVPQVTQQRILQHFGSLPAVEPLYLQSANGPHWIWWTLAILPIDVKAQVRILGIASLRRRLESLQRVLRLVQRYGPQGISQ